LDYDATDLSIPLPKLVYNENLSPEEDLFICKREIIHPLPETDENASDESFLDGDFDYPETLFQIDKDELDSGNTTFYDLVSLVVVVLNPKGLFVQRLFSQEVIEEYSYKHICEWKEKEDAVLVRYRPNQTKKSQILLFSCSQADQFVRALTKYHEQWDFACRALLREQLKQQELFWKEKKRIERLQREQQHLSQNSTPPPLMNSLQEESSSSSSSSPIPSLRNQDSESAEDDFLSQAPTDFLKNHLAIT